MSRAVPYLVIAALLTGFLVVFGLIAFEGANRALEVESSLEPYVAPEVAEPSIDSYTPMGVPDVWYGEPPPRLAAPIPATVSALRAIERESSPEILDTLRRDTTLVAIDLAVRQPVTTQLFVDAIAALYAPGGPSYPAMYFVSVLTQAATYADVCPLVDRLLEENLSIRTWLVEVLGTDCPGGFAYVAARERHSFAEAGPDAMIADPYQDPAYVLSLCDESERPEAERALVRCASDAAEPNERAAQCLRVLAGANWPLARRTAEAIEALDGEMAGWDEVKALRRFESHAAVERAAVEAMLVAEGSPRIDPEWSEVTVLHVLQNRARAFCFHTPRGLPLDHTWVLASLARTASLDGVIFEERPQADGTIELLAYMSGSVYRAYVTGGTAYDAYGLTGFVNALLHARGSSDRLVGVSGAGSCVARSTGGSVETGVREGYFTYVDLQAGAAPADTAEELYAPDSYPDPDPQGYEW
jgi:hypothetical protein